MNYDWPFEPAINIMSYGWPFGPAISVMNYGWPFGPAISVMNPDILIVRHTFVLSYMADGVGGEGEGEGDI